MVIQSLIESYGDKIFNGLDMTRLSRDKAYLIISNVGNNSALYLYSTYKDCLNCSLFDQYEDLPRNMITIITTTHERLYKVLTKKVDVLPSNSNEGVLCDLDTKFGQFGVYQLEIGDTDCTLETLKEPVNIYLPILTVIIIYFLLFLLLGICKYLIKSYGRKRSNDDVSNEMPEKKRVKSLDTFRGITIALMIFVNYGGGGYTFIDHAIWNGLHIADLVFPWFMWIMGVCIPMSIKSTVKSGISTEKALLNIARRSAILFLIGIFLGGSDNLNQMRIFGVLQRFGISYFVVASLCLLIMRNWEVVPDNKLNNFQNMFADILHIKLPWLVMIVIAVVHTVILFAVPYEDCPSGYLGPGGYHEDGIYINCTGGITGYIDSVILGNHVYHGALIRDIYRSESFDPEGILGCLTSIVQVFFGVQAGVTLMTFKKHRSRLVRWTIWAVICGIVGGGLCGFSKENGIIPLNKHLWSLSFVLVTSCFAFILLSMCYVLVDVKNCWSGKPFLYAGMNAILMYIGHSFTYSHFPIRWRLENNNTHFVTLLENVWATLMWILISYFLYKKKFFLTI